uniref:Uncharacterized protein n=1 Tax=Solanum tuberosum TaxID=4113 RepID=M1D6E5_SOLTU
MQIISHVSLGLWTKRRHVELQSKTNHLAPKYHTDYEGESPLIQGLFESLQHA